ncbi:spidroin-2-like [Fopius arisanus]|uniref:Galectin n=1 Tax=Fopius arisanus TaxID=64838 RepID=A0A9R1U2Z3_9HYME|nr:PREDICTED: spidroin-2-like [Fopius arisanus]
MASPVLNPDVPYVGEVGGLAPGKMVKIQGKIPSNAVRFAINYQLGPNLNPRDDIAIHLSPRFSDGFITRNHIQSMSWGPEENGGPLVLQPGQDFEVILLCEPLQYKIAINGRHFAEFGHRLPYQKVTHLVIDGDVEITSISYENIGAPRSPRMASAGDVPAADFGPPGPGGLYPTLNPQAPSAPQGGYGPPPGGYGPPGGGYNPPKPYGYQPGYEKAEEEEAFGGCLDKVGLAIGGLVAAGGVAAAVHAYNKRKEHDKETDHEKVQGSKTESEGGGLNLGALGSALASSLVSNALSGDNRHQPGYPPQGGGDMMGSILGALGGGSRSPNYPPPQQPNDPLGGLGSILGGVLGGGGGNQQPGYQPSGGYTQSGGYNQGSGSSDLLSGIGTALFSSALDSLSKRNSHGDERQFSPQPPPHYSQNYGPPRNDPPPPPKPSTPPPPGGGKLSAADISRGLGLGDDED